jgi:hypothetical protein
MSKKPEECKNETCSNCPEQFHFCEFNKFHTLLDGDVDEYLPLEKPPTWSGSCPGAGDMPKGSLNPVEGGIIAHDDGSCHIDALIDIPEGRLRVCLPINQPFETEDRAICVKER